MIIDSGTPPKEHKRMRRPLSNMCLPECTIRNSISTIIACDGVCSKWFHIQCVGLTEKQAKTMPLFFCPYCSEWESI